MRLFSSIRDFEQGDRNTHSAWQWGSLWQKEFKWFTINVRVWFQIDSFSHCSRVNPSRWIVTPGVVRILVVWHCSMRMRRKIQQIGAMCRKRRIGWMSGENLSISLFYSILALCLLIDDQWWFLSLPLSSVSTRITYEKTRCCSFLRHVLSSVRKISICKRSIIDDDNFNQWFCSSVTKWRNERSSLSSPCDVKG